MKRRWTIKVALAWLTLASAATGDSLPIRLRRATIDPSEQSAPRALAAPPGALVDAAGLADLPTTRSDGRSAYLLQTTRPLLADDRAALVRCGADLIGYVPDRAWIVLIRPDRLETLTRMPFARWIGGYRAAHKTDEALDPGAVRVLANGGEADLADPDTIAEVAISVMRPRYVNTVAEAVEQAGGTVTTRSAGPRWGTVHARMRIDAVQDLAALAEVEWIEPYAQPRIQNDVAASDALMNVHRVGTLRGLTGSGQIVAVADTGLDTGAAETLHPDFTNRVHAAFGWVDENDWIDRNGHGTHVAGSVLGNGAAFEDGRFSGMAPSARLIVQAIGSTTGGSTVYPPSPLSRLFEQAYTNNARIHSDSWGSSQSGTYTSLAREADEFMWDVDDMLVVFSAGNSGEDANADGIIDLGSINPPGTAKNVLTVGASESDRPAGSGGYSAHTWAIWSASYPADPIRNDLISTAWNSGQQGMAAFSSRGPTLDGRIKPDIVAPGTDIVSCRSRGPGAGTGWGTGAGVLEGSASDYYIFLGGTSMAAPLAAGAAALAREYLVDRRGIANPTAALQKALLVNGARSLAPGQYGTEAFREIPDTPRPNPVEGWGHVDLDQTLFPDNGTANILWDRQISDTALTNRYPIVITGTNEWRATLAWSDYPATLAAAKQLVNDLDLRIITPAGHILHPGGHDQPDRLNNLLGIDVSAPELGTNWIEVIGHHVPQGPQPYALVVKAEGHVPPVLQVQSLWTSPSHVFDNHTTAVFTSVAPGPDGLWAVKMAWRVNAADWQNAALTWVSSSGQTELFQGELPVFSAGDHVEYYVTAIDLALNTADSITQDLHIGSSTLYVSPSGSAEWPYNTWDTALRHPQDALDIVHEGHTVKVGDGVYSGRTLTVDRPVVLHSVNGPEQTVIHGDNARRCIEVTADAHVAGFRFRAGLAPQDGGAIWMNAGTISNCVAETSRALRYGGGLAILGGTAQRMRLSHNRADMYGGGAVVRDGRLINSVVHDNWANRDAGGIEFWGGEVVNCTIAFNHADHYGGGLDIGATGLVLNNIVVNNTADLGGDNWYKWVDEALRYCVTSPAPDDTGSFDADPLFASPGARNFRLKSKYGRYVAADEWTHDAVTSPAIDMGYPGSDASNEPYPNGGRINIGAYGNTERASKGHDEWRKLVIVSDPDAVSPAAGLFFAPTNTLVECVATQQLVTAGLTQYEFASWRLTGVTDTEGRTTGTNAAFSLRLTENAILDWRWHTNYYVQARAEGHGSVPHDDGWRRTGTHLSLQAEPDLYYGLSAWTGTLTSTANPLPVLVDRPHDLAAIFEPLVTSQGTPHVWLATYGWTNDFETAALADPDEDGMPTWQEYIAGTDPLDQHSVLKAHWISMDGGYAIRWRGKKNRVYDLLHADSLPVGPAHVLYNLHTTVEADITLPLPEPDEPQAFYWIRVRLP